MYIHSVTNSRTTFPDPKRDETENRCPTSVIPSAKRISEPAAHLYEEINVENKRMMMGNSSHLTPKSLWIFHTLEDLECKRAILNEVKRCKKKLRIYENLQEFACIFYFCKP